MIIYFNISIAKAVHDAVLEISGWRKWIKDIWSLESALSTIQNDTYYPTFEEKLAKILFSVIKNHSFEDGNKRTALALGAYFLIINDYKYCVQDFLEEFENLVVAIADSIISQETLVYIVTDIINQDEHSEELKLKIIHSYEYAINSGNN